MQISLLELQTHDLPATRQFYHYTLGWPLLEDRPEYIRLQLTHSELVFHQVLDTIPLYHIAFNIPRNQVHEAMEWMRTKAPVIPVDEKNLVADFSTWNAEAFYFTDPAGNILELIARRDLENSSDQPFYSKSILSVSEVGLVTNHVHGLCRQLNEKFEIGFFPKQPPQENFAAVGDDEGLFIVVGNQRPWYPTSVLSSIHWLKIHFLSHGREYVYEHLPENL